MRSQAALTLLPLHTPSIVAAKCDTVACDAGYFLKADAATLTCATATCDQTSDKTKCCDKENECIAKTDAMWKEYGCVVDTPTATTVSGG